MHSFNHTNKKLYYVDILAGKVHFATTHYVNIMYQMKTYMHIFFGILVLCNPT